MLSLHTIKKNKGSTHRKKVVGRGLGSGKGTYSTRGGKGQTARTGHSKMPAGFEGGRQPLVRQLPKSRGFRSLTPKHLAIDITKLKAFSDGDEVTIDSLAAKKLVRNPKGATIKVKIVGKGKLATKLQVKVPTTSSVKETIEKAGGSVS